MIQTHFLPPGMLRTRAPHNRARFQSFSLVIDHDVRTEDLLLQLLRNLLVNGTTEILYGTSASP